MKPKFLPSNIWFPFPFCSLPVPFLGLPPSRQIGEAYLLSILIERLMVMAFHLHFYSRGRQKTRLYPVGPMAIQIINTLLQNLYH